MANTDECSFSVALQFSKYPGGRFKSDGPYSGEQFREEVLKPLLDKCAHLTINLSGANGYGASFLDESFGELGKIFGEDVCRRRLTLIADDDPTLIPLIWTKVAKGAAEGPHHSKS
jgi:hypothetical protein